MEQNRPSKPSMSGLVESSRRSVTAHMDCRTSRIVCAVFTLLTLYHVSALAGPDRTSHPLRWGENQSLFRWTRYSYEIRSAYPFWQRLPVLEEFPRLLKYSELRQTDLDILVSQLQTLSRCDFVGYPNRDYQAAFQKWQDWWDYHGAQLADRLRTEGQSYPEAWQAIAGPSGIPCPGYPIVLPSAWSFQLSFRSGDYGAVVEEVIDMRVSPMSTSLTRRYHRATGTPWQSEEWEGLTVQEAHSALASLIYAIDNPWVYADDTLADNRTGLIKGIKGRPKEWSNYYPSVSWSGVMDTDGRVLINDDVWSWHATDRRERRSSLDYPIGVVFRVIRDRFPDPSWKATRSKWKAVK